MFRRLASRGSVKAVAFAGGVALSAYMLNSAALQAAEEPSIFVINGFYMAMREKSRRAGLAARYPNGLMTPRNLLGFTLS